MKKKIHLSLSVSNISRLHAMASASGNSVSDTADLMLTLGFTNNIKVTSRRQVLPGVIADLEARIAKGTKEYGEPLTTNNGRKALLDAYEEQLDQVLYLKQELMERGQ